MQKKTTTTTFLLIYLIISVRILSSTVIYNQFDWNLFITKRKYHVGIVSKSIDVMKLASVEFVFISSFNSDRN